MGSRRGVGSGMFWWHKGVSLWTLMDLIVDEDNHNAGLCEVLVGAEAEPGGC